MTTLRSNIRAVGLAQRLLLWAVLTSIIGWLLLPLLIFAIPFQLYAVFKLAKALTFSTSSAVMYFIAMFLPIVGFICLLMLNNKATVVLQTHGFRVGLMGVKISDLPPV